MYDYDVRIEVHGANSTKFTSLDLGSRLTHALVWQGPKESLARLRLTSQGGLGVSHAGQPVSRSDNLYSLSKVC